MRHESNKKFLFFGEGGFNIIELLIVVAVGLVVMAAATPIFSQMLYSIRLKSAAGDLSGLIQLARIQAAKNNGTYTIKYQSASGSEQAYIDKNNNNQWDSGEPIITFNSAIVPASGAPNGSGGAPSNYVLVGDTGTTNYDNATTLGFSPRGLPCAYASGTCSTPAGGYFVYYLTDQRNGSTGWAAVIVSRSGRSRTSLWNGTAWQ